MAFIYHITTGEEWEQAQKQGYYTAPSLDTEGFIHCSEAPQVAGVLNRYFTGKDGLLRLSIDTDKLQSLLKYEQSPSVDEEFPHIYGPINLDAVIAVQPIK